MNQPQPQTRSAFESVQASSTEAIPTRIHLQITDTATGGVAVHHSFRPAVGHPLSPAQGYALDLIAQIHRTWGAGSVMLCDALAPPAPAQQSASPPPDYRWIDSEDTEGGDL